LSKLSAWLAPQTKELGHRLIADYSEIEALQYNKVELVQWMTTARSFTRNEIREACGYERIEQPEMDKVYDMPVLCDK
jgi:phage portal protein BeeE